jgi:hypothetical protein
MSSVNGFQKIRACITAKSELALTNRAYPVDEPDNV